MSEPKCPMGHEMELFQIASGGWRYGCRACATSFKSYKRERYGWISPIKSTKERAKEAAIRRPLQRPLTMEAIPDNEVVYLELNPKNGAVDIDPIVFELSDRSYAGMLRYARFGFGNRWWITASDCGKMWRCWAYRPTEEERSAAEWTT